jgi:phytoene dehydrogenase-like protein
MPYRSEYDAVVVGSGPNGLAAAITFAQAGRSVIVLEAKDSIGGGTRTEALTLSGFRHDVCSAIHPLALASPFFRSLDLEAHGLEWVHPPVPLAHPLDDGSAVLLERSLDATAEGLGQDADSYLRLVGPLLQDWEQLVPELLRSLGIPRYPLPLIRFGRLAIRSAWNLARSWFKGVKAQALFAGNAAHAIFPLQHLSSAGFGLMLCMAGHAVGWPIARRGSQAIADALVSCLVSLGGEVRIEAPVSSMSDLPGTRTVLFDVTPRQLARIAASIFPSDYLERLQTYRYGSGAFKVDWALDGPIPWKNPRCSQAGTLHLGGTLEEVAAAELDVWGGLPPEKPFVLLSQPSLFDSTRAPEGSHTAWGYCHVPNGSTVDMTGQIEAQVERFAPGFQSRVVARHIMSPSELEAYNPNYVGGDITGGAQSLGNLFGRPLGRWSTYSTPAKGLYICSSSMPPGAGVHGMCGHLAAMLALKEVI